MFETQPYMFRPPKLFVLHFKTYGFGAQNLWFQGAKAMLLKSKTIGFTFSLYAI